MPSDGVTVGVRRGAAAGGALGAVGAVGGAGIVGS